MLIRLLALLALFLPLNDGGDEGSGDSGDDGGGSEGESKPDGSRGKVGSRAERQFGQDELTRIVGRETEQARKAEQSALLEKLGVDSIDDAAAVLKAQREREEKDKDDLTKATETAAEAQQAAVAAQATAEAATLRAEVIDQLLDVGDDENPLAPLVLGRKDLAVRLATDLASEAEGETMTERVTAAVKTVRAQSPEWFGETVSSTGNGQGRVITPTGDKPGSHRGESKAKTGLAQGGDDYDELMAGRKRFENLPTIT